MSLVHKSELVNYTGLEKGKRQQVKITELLWLSTARFSRDQDGWAMPWMSKKKWISSVEMKWREQNECKYILKLSNLSFFRHVRTHMRHALLTSSRNYNKSREMLVVSLEKKLIREENCVCI